jgi:hypothetical protein
MSPDESSAKEGDHERDGVLPEFLPHPVGTGRPPRRLDPRPPGFPPGRPGPELRRVARPGRARGGGPVRHGRTPRHGRRLAAAHPHRDGPALLRAGPPGRRTDTGDPLLPRPRSRLRATGVEGRVLRGAGRLARLRLRGDGAAARREGDLRGVRRRSTPGRRPGVAARPARRRHLGPLDLLDLRHHLRPQGRAAHGPFTDRGRLVPRARAAADGGRRGLDGLPVRAHRRARLHGDAAAVRLPGGDVRAVRAAGRAGGVPQARGDGGRRLNCLLFHVPCRAAQAARPEGDSLATAARGRRGAQAAGGLPLRRTGDGGPAHPRIRHDRGADDHDGGARRHRRESGDDRGAAAGGDGDTDRRGWRGAVARGGRVSGVLGSGADGGGVRRGRVSAHRGPRGSDRRAGISSSPGG